MNNQNYPNILTLRGLACILVVLFHVIQSFLVNNIITSESFLVMFGALLAFVRMPFFTFLSGYVYSIRPVKENYFKFYLKKIRRLFFPLIFVGIPVVALQQLSKDNFSILTVMLSPIYSTSVYWFLTAMLIIFGIITLIEKQKMIQTKKSIFILLLITSIFYISPLRDINFLSIGNTAYIFPFFILGIIIQRYSIKNNLKPLFLLLTILTILYLIYEIFYIKSISIENVKNPNILYLIFSMIFCIFLYFYNKKYKILDFIGKYSYSIFLFHVLFLGFFRIILLKLFDHKTIEDFIYILLFIFTFLGVLFPIVLDKIFSLNKYTSLIFLGKNINPN